MNSFAERLINWYTGNKRDLPWRRTNDPYAIWLSEIILQQTRVEQGLPYWERFMKNFPTVISLADADQDSILRLWQGLGYYSRARNLHAAAKYIRDELDGKFPNTYNEILKLKGVGPYTAAAIASFCFGESTPVVDGNVFRFAARFFGIKEDIASSKARKVFENILQKHIPAEDPGSFNQGLMEFGSRQCSPAPNCLFCTFQVDCYAFQQGLQKQLPIKKKKVKVRDRFFNYLVLERSGSYFMKIRQPNDIWEGLYDFFLIEGKLEVESVLNELKNGLQVSDFSVSDISNEYKHILSHQRIHATFYHIEIKGSSDPSRLQSAGLHPFSEEEILNLPKPKLIVNYLNQVGIN